MDIIAKRYAESLFDLAKEEQAIESYQKDMEKVYNVFLDKTFVQFFSHVAIVDDVKMDILKKSFDHQISEYVLNFLLLLVKKRRIRYILGICQQFQILCYEYFDIKIGKLYTPYSLSTENIEKVEKAMSQKEGKKVKLRMIIDESLIGGMRVEIDNHIYDDSLSYKLESLRQELLRK
jgi:ATP synthase, F1 delta subunit